MPCCASAHCTLRACGSVWLLAINMVMVVGWQNVNRRSWHNCPWLVRGAEALARWVYCAAEAGKGVTAFITKNTGFIPRSKMVQNGSQAGKIGPNRIIGAGTAALGVRPGSVMRRQQGDGSGGRVVEDCGTEGTKRYEKVRKVRKVWNTGKCDWPARLAGKARAA